VLSHLPLTAPSSVPGRHWVREMSAAGGGTRVGHGSQWALGKLGLGQSVATLDPNSPVLDKNLNLFRLMNGSTDCKQSWGLVISARDMSCYTSNELHGKSR
jgi:hypothetical protein